MRPFTTFTAVAAPIDLPNVDTDRIIPARFLRKGKNAEYGRYLFHDLRLGPDGAEDPAFVLNQRPYRDAKMLVTADNFGCGSSREMAVWALDAYGIRVVVAPSLGDIFHQNCVKNGLLPVILPRETTAALRRALHARPGATVTVDLAAQTVTAPDGVVHGFEIDPFRKEMLLTGKDEIALTFGYEARIEEFEMGQAAEAPWLLTARSIGVLGGRALHRVRALAGARRAALTVCDASHGWAYWVAVDADMPTRLPAGAAFPLELLGDLGALRRGEPKLVDVTAVLHRREARMLVEEGITHFVAVPVVVEGDLVGSLNVPAPSPGGLDVRAMALARAVAAQLAPAAAQVVTACEARPVPAAASWYSGGRMRTNTLREIWRRGEAVVNGWLAIPAGFSAEVMAYQGFDSLTVDMQHGVVDYEHAVAMLQGISCTPVIPLARVPWLEAGRIMKVLDAGAFGIICPMISTRAQAEELVACCKYPPAGYRSFGPVRASIYMGGDYAERANDELIVLPMIETREALKNLDDILSVSGIDGVYVGPADLSLALGCKPRLDQTDEPVVEAQHKILEACRKHGVIAGIHNATAAYALKMIADGYQFVTLASDTRFLAAKAAEEVAAVRKRGVRAGTLPVY